MRKLFFHNTEANWSRNVIKQITYTELNNYILRLPSFRFEDRNQLSYRKSFGYEGMIFKV
jgi:hypothetical protein